MRIEIGSKSKLFVSMIDEVRKMPDIVTRITEKLGY